MATTIAIVESQRGLRRQLKKMIATDFGAARVHAYSNWKTELRAIFQLAPDVIITDIGQPEGGDFEGISRLKRLLPQTQILIFSACEENEQILRALRAGAAGYLLKRTAPKELLSAIHEIKRGGVPMSCEVARKVLQSFWRAPFRNERTDSLTAREQEILQLLAEGGLSREIAQRLSISLETVNSHLKHIYGKLQVRSRTEAVIKYLTQPGGSDRWENAATSPRDPLRSMAHAADRR